MEVTSVWFYLFVGISLLIYWRLPQKYQWKLLLADSILFYCFNAHPATILYLAVSIVSVHCAVSYFKKMDVEALWGDCPKTQNPNLKVENRIIDMKLSGSKVDSRSNCDVNLKQKVETNDRAKIVFGHSGGAEGKFSSLLLYF